MKSRFQAKSFNINARFISTHYAGICAQYLHCLWMWVSGIVSTWRRGEEIDMQISQIYCRLLWASGQSLRMHAGLAGLDCTAVRGCYCF